jgi:hypothetical protein
VQTAALAEKHEAARLAAIIGRYVKTAAAYLDQEISLEHHLFLKPLQECGVRMQIMT